jgi:hypothetical protein
MAQVTLTAVTNEVKTVKKILASQNISYTETPGTDSSVFVMDITDEQKESLEGAFTRHNLKTGLKKLVGTVAKGTINLTETLVTDVAVPIGAIGAKFGIAGTRIAIQGAIQGGAKVVNDVSDEYRVAKERFAEDDDCIRAKASLGKVSKKIGNILGFGGSGIKFG